VKWVVRLGCALWRVEAVIYCADFSATRSERSVIARRTISWLASYKCYKRTSMVVDADGIRTLHVMEEVISSNPTTNLSIGKEGGVRYGCSRR
jgi:hypothetical protein